MTTAALLNLAAARGHSVEYLHLPVCLSITVVSGNCYVGMDTSLRGHEEKERLVHELGHCEFGGGYNRHSPYDIKARAERRADKWSYTRLLPVGEVRQAFQRGCNTPWDIAEAFDVSCEFATKALACYKQIGLI